MYRFAGKYPKTGFWSEKQGTAPQRAVRVTPPAGMMVGDRGSIESVTGTNMYSALGEVESGEKWSQRRMDVPHAPRTGSTVRSVHYDELKGQET